MCELLPDLSTLEQVFPNLEMLAIVCARFLDMCFFPARTIRDGDPHDLRPKCSLRLRQKEDFYHPTSPRIRKYFIDQRPYSLLLCPLPCAVTIMNSSCSERSSRAERISRSDVNIIPPSPPYGSAGVHAEVRGGYYRCPTDSPQVIKTFFRFSLYA